MAFNLLLKTQLERFINNLKPQIHTYASSSTARDDVDKVASLNGFILGSGAKVSVKFTDTTTTDPSSGNITLNVNSTGAKTIIASETNEICTYEDASEFCDNKVHEFVYDGTNWIWVTNTIKDADALITTSEFEDFTSTSGMPITSMADTYVVDNSQLSSMFTSLSEIGNTVSSTSIAQSELDSTQDSILSSLSTASSELSSEMVVFSSEIDDKQDALLNPLTQADVKDNLSSTDTNKPLSAKQGKILRENISAKVEDGATSSTTRTAGEYITRNGVMYKVASNLASGSTITEGTNIVKKTVGEELTQINTNLSNKQDKLTNPLTKSDVINNLTTSTTNVPLSANQGKVLNTKITSYPKIYNCTGEIANSDGGAAKGTGVATVMLFANGLAKIDYQYTITTAGTSTATSNYKWGLNRDLLSARNSSIPAITPTNGGVATWFNPKSSNNWSTFNDTFNGFGVTHTVNSQFWCAARNYNGTAVGAFAVSNAENGMRICGTCYGTFTVT